MYIELYIQLWHCLFVLVYLLMYMYMYCLHLLFVCLLTRSYSERAQKSSYESYAPGYVPARNSFRRVERRQDEPHHIFIEREASSSAAGTVLKIDIT